MNEKPETPELGTEEFWKFHADEYRRRLGLTEPETDQKPLNSEAQLGPEAKKLLLEHKSAVFLDFLTGEGGINIPKIDALLQSFGVGEIATLEEARLYLGFAVAFMDELDNIDLEVIEDEQNQHKAKVLLQNTDTDNFRAISNRHLLSLRPLIRPQDFYTDSQSGQSQDVNRAKKEHQRAEEAFAEKATDPAWQLAGLWESGVRALDSFIKEDSEAMNMPKGKFWTSPVSFIDILSWEEETATQDKAKLERILNHPFFNQEIIENAAERVVATESAVLLKEVAQIKAELDEVFSWDHALFIRGWAVLDPELIAQSKISEATRSLATVLDESWLKLQENPISKEKILAYLDKLLIEIAKYDAAEYKVSTLGPQVKTEARFKEDYPKILKDHLYRKVVPLRKRIYSLRQKYNKK